MLLHAATRIMRLLISVAIVWWSTIFKIELSKFRTLPSTATSLPLSRILTKVSSVSSIGVGNACQRPGLQVQLNAAELEVAHDFYLGASSSLCIEVGIVVQGRCFGSPLFWGNGVVPSTKVDCSLGVVGWKVFTGCTVAVAPCARRAMAKTCRNLWLVTGRMIWLFSMRCRHVVMLSKFAWCLCHGRRVHFSVGEKCWLAYK